MKNNRLSGILVHPTSFPGPFGIGDLGIEAYNFIDFLENANQKLWQILPLTPTSFGDSPYQSFSTFAGNHLLISPEILALKNYFDKRELRDAPNFNQTKVNYGSVINYKNTLFKKAFKGFLRSSKEIQNAFNSFCKQNESWLDDYSLFVALKDFFIEQRKDVVDSKELGAFRKKYKDIFDEDTIKDYYYGAVWTTWPLELINRVRPVMDKYTKQLALEIHYQKFLQFEFFNQWLSLKQYANKNDIQVIGDIPIFVAYDSCDVWSNQELFYLDENGFPTVVAGVPPDYFSKSGQLWGNPIYNWQKNRGTDYKWWMQRLESAASMMDIIRIDHFRGFDEYWEVPFGEKTAINGKWVKGPGKNLFISIENKLGKLPIIAEDLGDLTPFVHNLRDTFNFPGMKVLQFAFDSNQNDYLPHNYVDTNSIVYSGTHDNDTTIGWYNNAVDFEKDYYRKYLNVSGQDIAWDFIRLAFSSVAKSAIIPIQDVMNLDSSHRMNTPGIAHGNWQFRYTSEMLTDDLAKGLKYISSIYNRNNQTAL